jgi:hypothetical protein
LHTNAIKAHCLNLTFASLATGLHDKYT